MKLSILNYAQQNVSATRFWPTGGKWDYIQALAFAGLISACGSGTGSGREPDVDAGLRPRDGAVSRGPDAAGPSDAGITADAGVTADAGRTPDGGLDEGSVWCNLTYDAFNGSPQVNAQSTYAWACTAAARLLTGNGIPDHAIVGGQFATPVGAQNISISFPLRPTVAGAVTTAPVGFAYGYARNSVKFDPATAGTCRSDATSTAPGSGCVMAMGRDPWRIEAIGGAFRFGTDDSNGHTQPNGQYHYHGMPEGLLANAGTSLTLVGFALDGFPIYARYGYSVANDPSSPITAMRASWQLKATPDAGRPSTGLFPMGTFTADYEFVAGSGDLDECNGRTGVTPEFPAGTYHYYITDTYPFIQRCLKGTPL